MNIIPIAKCEYAVWKAPGSVDPAKIGQPQVEYRYDVTLVWEDTNTVVKICLLDKRLGTWQWITVTSAAVQPSGCIMQYGSYLIVSLLDVGTYITWPSAFAIGTPNLPPQAAGYVPPSIPAFVTPELLGLDVCPTPQTYDFPEKLQGDLLIIGGQATAGQNDLILEYETVTPGSTADLSTDEYANNIIIRVPINAQYWRSGFLPPKIGGGTPPDGAAKTGLLAQVAGGVSYQIVSTGLIPRWQFANLDTNTFPNGETNANSSIDHLQHRGYFYRFCFIRQFTNADGNVVTQRSNPSVEIFVPAVNYSPFFWSSEGIPSANIVNGTWAITTDTNQAPNPGFPQRIGMNNDITGDGGGSFVPGDQWVDNIIWIDQNGNLYSGALPVAVPSQAEFIALRQKFRTYFGLLSDTGITSVNQNGDNDAADTFWAASWLGWSITGINVDFNGLPPWICDVSAERLLSCPQTIFNYSDFVGLPDDCTLIEVYRTAYEDVDPIARPVSTPLFQPHTYGLVGTILPGATFTDTTQIPDFGQDPIDFEGYLRGQFSGDVLYQYGQSPAIVLGNIRDDYSLLAPSPLMQCFFQQSSNGNGYIPFYLAIVARDGLPTTQFWFCYQDTTGYNSPATLIHIPDADDGTESPSIVPGFGGTPVDIFFTFPYGYDPNIANIILFSSQWADSPGWDTAHPTEIGQDPNGTRTLKQIAIVNPEPGTYCSTGADFNAGTVVSVLPGISDYKFYEPGAIIYSDPDQPWDWPQAQAEKHSSEFPVRGLFDQMGELGVATDSSYTLTLLRAAAPRSERETQEVGLITKNAIAKVQDSVVILSQAGLYFLVPSRAEDLPSHVTVELLAYLKDTIPNLMPLAALRRASIGYLKGRQEIWLHIPSDVDLWPMLPNLLGDLTEPNPSAQPQRTFVFGFGKSIRDMDCYTFDLCEDFEIKNYSQTWPPGLIGAIAGPDVVDPATYNHTPVLFCSGSDGGMFASWCDQRPGSPTLGNLITIDCDVPNVDFPCAWYGTLSLGLEEPSGQKQIEHTEVLMAARGQVQIITGIAKKVQYAPTYPSLPGGTSVLRGWDAIRGFIHNAARIFNFRKIYTDQPRRYTHPGSELGVETTGSTVMVRLRGTPDAQGRNKATLNGITVYYDQKHQHG